MTERGDLFVACTFRPLEQMFLTFNVVSVQACVVEIKTLHHRSSVREFMVFFNALCHCCDISGGTGRKSVQTFYK